MEKNCRRNWAMLSGAIKVLFNRWALPGSAVLLLDLDDDDACEEDGVHRRVGLGEADMMV
jgi:hypothetical protein